MLLGKKRQVGQYIDRIQVGDLFEINQKIDDKDILVYLGLSDDINPMYIQHSYTEQTSFQKPIVPHVMLIGLLYSCINKHVPGPGSVILSTKVDYPEVLYHYADIHIKLEVIACDTDANEVTFSTRIVDQDQRVVLTGKVNVSPPKPLKPLPRHAFDNF
ncbi:MaoC/PaaZ C-terminal domain-containing protein [Caldalkalibacillus salinus]|uniref:MaoC/PaaZ C-terminal domain-containing protein n=1 Tax=Caldalkalibacillus salinus TaxID=2803787 RepID=UPI001924FA10|nr:MaoC/PaaZ C-terminal domain-containing protein [Caldalkalibacillus salinus]